MELKIKKKHVIIILLLAMSGMFLWKLSSLNIKNSTIEKWNERSKYLNYLKGNEQEIVDFIKKQSKKVETVQIDWDHTRVGIVGNGLPWGGGKVVVVYGGFNGRNDTSWGISFSVHDNEISIDRKILQQPLRIRGDLLE